MVTNDSPLAHLSVYETQRGSLHADMYRAMASTKSRSKDEIDEYFNLNLDDNDDDDIPFSVLLDRA